MSDKTPMIRFLHEKARRAENKVSAARRHERSIKESEKLRERASAIVLTLPESREVIENVIDMLLEREELLLLRDQYQEAKHWLGRAGYGYPSGVEGKPTVLDMAEDLAQHRSGIQGFLERALSHFGVTEEEMADLRSGRNMQEFYKAHPNPSTRDEKHDEAREEEEITARALKDMQTATAAVQRKLASTLDVEEDDDVPWEVITHGAAQSMNRTKHWKHAHDLASKDNKIVSRQLEEAQCKIQGLETREKQLRAIIETLEEDVRVLHEGDETEDGTWRLHYIGMCQNLDIPRSVYGDVRAPQVDEIERYMGQVYAPMRKLQKQIEAIEKRLPHTPTETRETAQDREPIGSWSCCGQQHPTIAQFCPTCGKDAPVIPLAEKFKFSVGDRVFLTFAEARGETGVIADVGWRSRSDGEMYEYADVRVDKDGSRSGPLPVTCVMRRRDEDQD